MLKIGERKMKTQCTECKDIILEEEKVFEDGLCEDCYEEMSCFYDGMAD